MKTQPIGSADQVSFGDVMRAYARQHGLRRLVILVPLLAPRLSVLWLALVIPLYARVGAGRHRPDREAFEATARGRPGRSSADGSAGFVHTLHRRSPVRA